MLADSGLGGACFAWVKLVIIAGVPFLGWNSLVEQGFVVGVFNDYFPCVNWLGWRLSQQLLLHLCVAWRAFSRVPVLCLAPAMHYLALL